MIFNLNSFITISNYLFQYLKSDHKTHLHCFLGTIDGIHLFTSYFTEIKFGFTPAIIRENLSHKVIK